MQGRPANQDPEVGHLTIEKGYTYLTALLGAFGITTLGFGTDGTMTRPNSILTVTVVGGVTTALSLGIAVHECINLCGIQCCRRDGYTVVGTERPLTQYSLYLTLRMCSIASSAAGIFCFIADLVMNVETRATTTGILLLATGLSSSHLLGASALKPAQIELEEDEISDDVEMQLDHQDPPAPPNNNNDVPLVAAEAPMPALRTNQFFRPAAPAPAAAPAAAPAPAPTATAATQPQAPRVKKTRVKVYKNTGLKKK